MVSQHGGSRPVTRKDDGRLQMKAGESKLYKIRTVTKDELSAIRSLTPRQRALACLIFYEAIEINKEQFEKLLEEK